MSTLSLSSRSTTNGTVLGPATTFWNPANTASGDYTVKGTFLEPKFMELNSHAHSYGIVIGGNNMGTDQMSYVYCVAYGDGNALVRGVSGADVFKSSDYRISAPHGFVTILQDGSPVGTAEVDETGGADRERNRHQLHS